MKTPKLFLTALLSSLLFSSCQDRKKDAAATPRPEVKEATPDSGPIVIIETSMGLIKARLHEDTAPITVKNFLSYVDEKFYDETIFHRVMSDFMIQGGGFAIPESTAKEKETRDSIRNESHQTRKNTRGTLAMARTPDPHSASCQFFINVVDNPGLDYPKNGGGYAVFGEVIEGMEIVDQIKEVPTFEAPLLSLAGRKWIVNPSPNVPIDPVFIQSIRRAPADQ